MHKQISADRLGRWRGFPLLWTANLLNGLGSNLLGFALPLYVFQLTGKASFTSAAFIFGTLPRLLIGPIGGVISDRFDRRWLVATCSVLSALTMLPMLAVRDERSVWLLFGAKFCEHTLGQLSRPAEGGLIPLVAGRERLGRANALLTAATNVIQLAGPALGGFVYAIAGFPTVVLVNLASYLANGAMTALVRVPVTQASGGTGSVARDTLAEMMQGVRMIRECAPLAAVAVINAPAMMAEGISNAIWVVWVTGYLAANVSTFGMIQSIAGTGALVGSLLLAGRLDGMDMRLVFARSAFAIGLDLGLVVALPSIPSTTMLIFLVGPATMGFFIGTDVALQRWTPNSSLGRVLGMFSAWRGSMQLIGAFAAQQFTDGLGVRAMLGGVAMLWLITALVSRVSLANRMPVGDTGAGIMHEQEEMEGRSR